MYVSTEEIKLLQMQQCAAEMNPLAAEIIVLVQSLQEQQREERRLRQNVFL